MGYRIHLSPPDVGDEERALLLDAFDSNWVAPVGPHLDAFERELAETLGAEHVVALSSGTAALHLGLLLLGVGPGDTVITSTLTFAATVNTIRYVDAEPVLVDVEERSWNLSPDLLEVELAAAADRDELPAAIITVDLYGRCADYDRILPLADAHGIPIIEDAAEALGATHERGPAGTLGELGVLSFNGNKIITTSGGGAIVTDDPAAAERIRHLATQARDPAPHYQHSAVGYNYRLSNLLAALGRGQLRRLPDLIARRREINAVYRERLGDLPGVAFPPEDTSGEPNHWLTCLTIDPDEAHTDREAVRRHLGAQGIEARPVWKPMHLQPVFAEHRVRGGVVAERLFRDGLCLPSGSGLTDDEVDEVAHSVRGAFPGR